MSSIPYFFKAMVAGGIRIDNDAEGVRKILLLNVISMTGILTLSVLSSNDVRAVDGNLSFFNLLIAFILLFLHFYSGRTGKTHSSAFIGTALTGLLFIYLFVHGDVNHNGNAWSYTYPLFATFLLGAGTGTLFSLASVFVAANYKIFFTDNPDVVSILRFTCSYLVVTLFSFLFEVVRTAIQRRLAHKTSEMKVKIEELERAEKALQKSRDELEQRVEERTSALKSAVEDLQQQIVEREKAERALQRSNELLERRVRERTENIAHINEALRMEVLQREAAQAEALRARDASEQANQAKSEFLANMSHELRTPLNHVIGFTELVADKKVGDLNGTQEEYLRDVLGSSHYLLSLINDILDLSKVEAGKLELEYSEVNIHALMKASMSMVKEKATKHGIKLGVDYDGAPDRIRADERKLKQVMYNLLSNAMKFTSDEGAIQIRASRVSRANDQKKGETESAGRSSFEGLLISVSDNGIGIRKEDLKRIFAPFEQADNAATKSHHGTGLGLALSKRFVELHGGKIWAESEGPGKGSAFTFLIPVDGQQAGCS